MKSYFKQFFKRIKSHQREIEEEIEPELTILSCTENFDSKPLSSHVALVAHFDPDGMFDETFISYIKALKKSGYSVIVITTSRWIESEQIDMLLNYCSSLIHRQNIGLDFASWGAAINKYDLLSACKSIILTNDSVIGMVRPLNPIIEKFKDSDALFCGLTESNEISRHFQSYFLYIDSRAWENSKVYDFCQI